MEITALTEKEEAELMLQEAKTVGNYFDFKTPTKKQTPRQCMKEALQNLTQKHEREELKKNKQNRDHKDKGVCQFCDRTIQLTNAHVGVKKETIIEHVLKKYIDEPLERGETPPWDILHAMEQELYRIQHNNNAGLVVCCRKCNNKFDVLENKELKLD